MQFSAVAHGLADFFRPIVTKSLRSGSPPTPTTREPKRNRDAAFDPLAGAGAELVTTEMVAFEWLRTAEHPAFKNMLALVK